MLPQRKSISLLLCFLLILEQSAFAQSIDLSRYFVHSPSQAVSQSDKFRPLHLRYLGYDNLSQNFKLLLDQGDTKKEDLENKTYIEENTQTLLKYFFVGLALPNDKFWVNLRPDSPDNIFDPDLEKTDIGRIFLEADLQLKKDTASFTSPQTPEGKGYWDKLYQKAVELFGTENITIPTLTRPWIVPNEIIIREAPDNAYIYKATLKVMLEEDYLQGHTYEVREPHLVGVESVYSFSDPRLKELNQYSTQLIKDLIIPKLTYEVNTSKRYAPLRQVYYSLILAQWFKQRFKGRFSESSSLLGRTVPAIDSGDLTNLISKDPYDKQSYFKQYQKSFAEGEYNLTEPAYTPYGQSIRRYVSGGMKMNCSSSLRKGIVPAQSAPHLNPKYILPLALNGGAVSSSIEKEVLPVLSLSEENIFNNASMIGNKLLPKLLEKMISALAQESMDFPNNYEVKEVKRLMQYSVKGKQAYLVELINSKVVALAHNGINIIIVVDEKTKEINRVWQGIPKKISPAVALFRAFKGKRSEFSPNESGEDFIALEEGHNNEVDRIRKGIVELLKINSNKLAEGRDNYDWEILMAPENFKILKAIKEMLSQDANIANAINHLLSLPLAKGFSFLDGVLYLKAKNVEGGHYRPADGSIFINEGYNYAYQVSTFIHELSHHIFHNLGPEQRIEILRYFGKKFSALKEIIKKPLYKHLALYTELHKRLFSKDDENDVFAYEGLINEVFAYTLEAVVNNERSRLGFPISESDVGFLKAQGLLPKGITYRYVEDIAEISEDEFLKAFQEVSLDAREELWASFSKNDKMGNEENEAKEFLNKILKSHSLTRGEMLVPEVYKNRITEGVPLNKNIPDTFVKLVPELRDVLEFKSDDLTGYPDDRKLRMPLTEKSPTLAELFKPTFWDKVKAFIKNIFTELAGTKEVVFSSEQLDVLELKYLLPIKNPNPAPVGTVMQKCIDDMARVIFDRGTNSLVADDTIVYQIAGNAGITMEELAGGSRGCKIYKLSQGGAPAIVVKFFPPDSWQLLELKALKKMQGNSLFQQYLIHKDGTSDAVGYIVTDFIPGKSFYVNISDWGLVNYANKQKEHLDNLMLEIKGICEEHWEQLVLIFEFADKSRIAIDAVMPNFKYDKKKGFVALDYLVSDFMRSSNDVREDAVTIIAGLKNYMIGKHKVYKYIIQQIEKAEKRLHKRVKGIVSANSAVEKGNEGELRFAGDEGSGYKITHFETVPGYWWWGLTNELYDELQRKERAKDEIWENRIKTYYEDWEYRKFRLYLNPRPEDFDLLVGIMRHMAVYYKKALEFKFLDRELTRNIENELKDETTTKIVANFISEEEAKEFYEFLSKNPQCQELKLRGLGPSPYAVPLKEDKEDKVASVAKGHAETREAIAKRKSSSSIEEDKGGVAFNALPIQTESVVSSVLGSFPGAKAFQGDLDTEWTQIQQVFNAGIRPSIQRISEYTAAAAYSALASQRVDQVRAILADILRRDEEDEKLPVTQPAVKKFLSALESDNPL